MVIGEQRLSDDGRVVFIIDRGAIHIKSILYGWAHHHKAFDVLILFKVVLKVNKIWNVDWIDVVLVVRHNLRISPLFVRLICARNGNVVQIGDSGVHGVVHDDSCVVGLIDSGGY